MKLANKFPNQISTPNSALETQYSEIDSKNIFVEEIKYLEYYILFQPGNMLPKRKKNVGILTAQKMD